MSGKTPKLRGRGRGTEGRVRKLRSRARAQRARALLFAGAAVLVTALGVTLYLTDALRGLELGSVDQRFSIRPDAPQPKEVSVVAVDDKTFDELKLQWPFPRGRHAAVIDRLRRDGARVIVVDLQFTEESDSIEDDNALYEAVTRVPRIALAATEADADGNTRVFGGGTALEQSGARVGMGLFPNDRGGIIRRMHHTDQRVVTLPVVAAGLMRGRSVARSELGGSSAWIDFRGPPGAIETHSYSDVLQNQFARGTFRDRVVVVGPSALSLQDVHPTSTTGEGLMSGAEIQASAAWTALHGFPLQSSPRWVGALIVLLMALAAPLAFYVLDGRFAGGLLLALGAVYAVVAQLLFNAGTIVPLLYPLAALLIGLVVALGVMIATGAFERERVRDLFSRFVPESVVREVLAKIDDDLRLGGERRIATVLFSDLRGFTTYADTRTPDEVIGVLNRYLTAMSDVILDHGGTLVAYMGDGIMAVFGAPIEEEDHADRAFAAAREMTGPALESFNAWMREAGVGPGFKMGVGLNSGAVMSGNVGSQRRLEYTAIGDTTNTAARLESMTKGTPFSVFVSASTRSMLRDVPDDLVHVDHMEIRGKQERISVWGLLGAGVEAPPVAEAQQPAQVAEQSDPEAEGPPAVTA
ncbi:MAG: adenylate/guanylate cyclase domain-containing protein [Solirubrobacterales bacterium]|nr:adenylate/guanylate cyclase domain-containing protein [Solirubrobacterales bacterium]